MTAPLWAGPFPSPDIRDCFGSPLTLLPAPTAPGRDQLPLSAVSSLSLAHRSRKVKLLAPPPSCKGQQGPVTRCGGGRIMAGGPDRWTVGPANRRSSTQRIAVPSASLSPETEITADWEGWGDSLRLRPPCPPGSSGLGGRRLAGKQKVCFTQRSKQANPGSGSPRGAR